jgi:hypothetical protein
MCMVGERPVARTTLSAVNLPLRDEIRQFDIEIRKFDIYGAREEFCRRFHVSCIAREATLEYCVHSWLLTEGANHHQKE